MDTIEQVKPPIAQDTVNNLNRQLSTERTLFLTFLSNKKENKKVTN